MNAKSNLRKSRTSGNVLVSLFQPALPWSLMCGLILFSLLCTLAGSGRILNFAFPAGSFLIGILFYVRYPILYIGFTWWLWFLAPFVRRLADFSSSFSDPSPILLSPFLVTFISALTLWRSLPKLKLQNTLPFVLPIVGISYGFTIGLLNHSPVGLLIAFLDWLTPVIFAFHLFANWRNYPLYKKTIQRVFAWAVLVTGTYGIFQFLVAPEWDRIWLKGIELTSMGNPEPLGIRVWSTMNAPGPFATFMTAGLLLLFSYQSPIKIFASATGYLAFLLTLARSAWVAWLVGLFAFATNLDSKRQLKLLQIIAVTAVLIIPLTTIEPFSEEISSRFDTFTSLEDDNSLQARQRTYGSVFSRALLSFLGSGISGKVYDSTILTALIHLGWIGSIFYMSGLLFLAYAIFSQAKGISDPFFLSARAIFLSIFIKIPFGFVIVELNGVLMWSFLAIAAAAKMYHQNPIALMNRQPNETR